MSEHNLKQYLGDGVYAECDGFSIWLRTQRAEGVHEIALEPKVMAALLDYLNRLKWFVEQNS